MKKYCYVFGYENIEEWHSNKDVGTDFESTCVFLIVADSSEQALLWGRELSKWYVARLFTGVADVRWNERDFASWIEETPDSEDKALAEAIGPINVGAFPDFDTVRKHLAN